jgi:signal transduction histidine kinase
MMSKISRSLSRKLSINIILLAVPIFVLSLGIFYLQSRYLIRQEAIERSNSILRTVIQRVSNYMGSIEAPTNANARLLEQHFTPDSLESISRRIVMLNPRILSCTVSIVPDMFPQYGRQFSVYTVNDDGKISTVRETDFNYFDKPWYKVPVNMGKAGWVEPFEGHTEGTIDHNEAVATYCQPLRSETGQIIGVIATDFSFRHLAKTINDAERPYPHAYFVLTGENGRFFIHPDTTQLFRKTIFTDADPQLNADRIALGHEMVEGKQGTMHFDINDTRCHVCYQPVPGTKWSLALVCPDKEVLTDYRQLGYVIIALIILGLLGILWLCQRVVRQTISPINKLLNTTRHITDGNYDLAIPFSHQKDDIGLLQNSFAVMQQKLRDHMGSIRETADALRKHNEQRARDMELAEETVKKKTLFIQNLSHQIRTPLNIILGFANVLQESIASRSKNAAALSPVEAENLSDMTSIMKYNADHLKRMVLMLFDSSSTTGADELMSNRHDEVSCNDVARESIEYTLGHFQRIKVNFETELSDATRILTNRLYLMRTIRELLYNAAKFSDGKHITLHVSENETSVCFTVQDVGPGLPDNADELIYKPFVKSDDLSDGLGLGLPLCKRHALSLGGDLIYDDSYHDGCRFIVEMPK